MCHIFELPGYTNKNYACILVTLLDMFLQIYSAYKY